MTRFNKTAAIWTLALAAGLTAGPLFAATQIVSSLGGKFTFNLPTRYQAETLPAGDAAHGTAGASGTLYSDPATKSVVIVAQTLRNDGMSVKDNDPLFLDGVVASFVKQQSAALKDFKQLGEKKLTHKGLGLRQVDSSATMGGGKTLNSTFLAGSGNHLLVIQAISRADDKRGHGLLVKQITGAK